MIKEYKGKRDPRFVTRRRGGTLDNQNHFLLVVWAAKCAEHVLHYFSNVHPTDNRPKDAIEKALSWSRGDISMTEAREAAYAAHDAAKSSEGAASFAARSAGHAVATAHMADHELGAAAYAIKAVMSASTDDKKEINRKKEMHWQREQLPKEIRILVISDQKNRNDKFWSLFSED
jgi:hypothetical protein